MTPLPWLSSVTLCCLSTLWAWEVICRWILLCLLSSPARMVGMALHSSSSGQAQEQLMGVTFWAVGAALIWNDVELFLPVPAFIFYFRDSLVVNHLSPCDTYWCDWCGSAITGELDGIKLLSVSLSKCKFSHQQRSRPMDALWIALEHVCWVQQIRCIPICSQVPDLLMVHVYLQELHQARDSSSCAISLSCRCGHMSAYNVGWAISRIRILLCKMKVQLDVMLIIVVLFPLQCIRW